METVDGRFSHAVVRVTFGVTLDSCDSREGDIGFQHQRGQGDVGGGEMVMKVTFIPRARTGEGDVRGGC